MVVGCGLLGEAKPDCKGQGNTITSVFQNSKILKCCRLEWTETRGFCLCYSFQGVILDNSVFYTNFSPYYNSFVCVSWVHSILLPLLLQTQKSYLKSDNRFII